MPSVAVKVDYEETDLFFAEENVCVLLADARLKLRKFDDGEFQCCVTSPPYWGLRDYDHPNQIGAEAKLDDYIADLVSVFRELRRTLRDDGTFWLNIGDAYTSGGRTWRAPDKKNKGRAMTQLEHRFREKRCRPASCADVSSP